MMILSRRSFFTGLAATLAAPAIIRTPGLLMPVKSINRSVEVTTISLYDEIDLSPGALNWAATDGMIFTLDGRPFMIKSVLFAT